MIEDVTMAPWLNQSPKDIEAANPTTTQLVESFSTSSSSSSINEKSNLPGLNDTTTSKTERRLVRKQDLLILPLLALSIMMGYLDRATIGNARLLGMQKDLRLSNQEYLNCVMLFFLGYMVIELPAGMTLRYAHPRYVFSGALFAFGTFTILMGGVDGVGYAGVMVLRVFVGLAEAFVNNAFIFVSLWYRPSELSLRTAAIYSMTPIAGAVSGLIAYGVGKHLNGVWGLEAWKWLFIIEGSMTIFIGFLVLAMLPGLPETVAENKKRMGVLRTNAAERSMISQRLRSSQNTTHATFQSRLILLAFSDSKMYLCALIIGPVGIGIGSFSIVLPTLIHNFGFAPLESQLLTLIPYGFGLIGLIFFAWLSDHFRRKAAVTLVCMALTCTGFVVLMATTNKIALIAGACFVAAGAYPALVISTAWAMTIHGGYTKRATAIWVIQIVVQCYSILSTQVYRKAPRFFLGHAVSLALYVVGAVSVLVLWWVVRKANRDREARRQSFEVEGTVDPEMEKSFEDLGDFHPAWVYVE